MARSFVAGDDPGRLRLTSGSGTLVLNLLTFALLFVWAFWRGVTQLSDHVRKPFLILGLLLCGWLFLRPILSPGNYLHPQWFIAWEWLTAGVLFVLARRLGNGLETSRRLLAVFLATAVSLCATTIYQQVSGPLNLPAAGIPLDPEAAQLLGSDEFAGYLDSAPVSTSSAKATFDRPETFALWLLPLLPMVIVIALAGFRDGSSRGWLLVGLVVVFLSAFLMAAVGSFTDTFRDRLATLSAGVEVISQQGWIGVGGGNFSRVAPGEIFATSFWLHLWAEYGILPVVLLLLFAGFLLRLVFQGDPEHAEETPEEVHTRWEFHLGGVFGLLLGFVLSRGDIPAEAPSQVVFAQGIAAGIRAFLWFAAFGLFEIVALPTKTLLRCLSGGLLSVGVLGLISHSPYHPSLFHSFAILSAILMNLAIPGKVVPSVLWIPRAWLPVPLTLAFLVGCWFHVSDPGISTTTAIREGRRASRFFPEKQREVWKLEGMEDTDRNKARIARARADANNLLNLGMLEPLRKAVNIDPGNAALHLELAHWSRWHWELLLKTHQAEEAAHLTRIILERYEYALKLDARNPAPILGEIEMLLLMIRETPTLRRERVVLLNKRLEALPESLRGIEVSIRYRLVSRLLEVSKGPSGGKETLSEKEARETIESQALLLVEKNGAQGHGTLSDTERQRIINWLLVKLPGIPTELKEFVGVQ